VKAYKYKYSHVTLSLDPTWPRQLANMNYGVFVRPGIGYCGIQWSQVLDDPYSFTLSSDSRGSIYGTLGKYSAWTFVNHDQSSPHHTRNLLPCSELL